MKALIIDNKDELNNESEILLTMAGMYANEPCRICGVNLTMYDIKNGAVFAGYSKDNKSRAAHKECWQKNVPLENWRHQ